MDIENQFKYFRLYTSFTSCLIRLNINIKCVCVDIHVFHKTHFYL